MELTGLRNMLTQTGDTVVKHSPSILTGAAVGGMFLSNILVAKATYLALLDLQDREESDFVAMGDAAVPLTNREILELVWKRYIPAAVAVTMAGSAVIAANKVNLSRQAALLSLYEITSHSLKQYQSTVLDEIGPKKEGKVRDAMAIREMKAADPSYIHGTGGQLFFDSLSGRFFYSDVESIRKALNDYNAELHTDMYKTLNDFYWLIDLTPVKMGERNGWSIDDGVVDIHFTTTLTEQNEACIVMTFKDIPKAL